ncbi:hypothetical protein MTBSS4_90039 [Magnetospirillum sp. SS-4]|nr:hypothetical protein MTBSS4_90039 [Magnetospirillum sp. SS-4]
MATGGVDDFPTISKLQAVVLTHPPAQAPLSPLSRLHPAATEKNACLFKFHLKVLG